MSGLLREALINIEAISANVHHLRALAATEHTLVVVKANAYGHGAVHAARAAVDGGADWNFEPRASTRRCSPGYTEAARTLRQPSPRG
jgi:hypothetical protein